MSLKTKTVFIDWKDKFRPQILKRGRKYASDGAVLDLKELRGRITAIVRGSEYYKVDIRHVDGTVTDAYCTCPYAADGEWCKHIAAVLYIVDPETKDPEGLIKSDKIDPIKAVPHITPIKTIIESADRKELESVLIGLADSDSRIESRIRANLKEESLPDLEHTKEEIDEIFYSYSDRSGFIDYRNAFSFESDLSMMLKNRTKAFIIAGQYIDAFNLSVYAYVKLGNQDIDDDGEISELSRECYAIWQSIVSKCSSEEKEYIKNWFKEHSEDGTVIDYMGDTLKDFLRYELSTKTELVNEIHRLEKMIDKSKGLTECEKVYIPCYGYYIEAIEFRNILAKKVGISNSEIEDYMRGHMNLRSVRNYFINKAREERDVKEEIRLLIDGKKYERDSVFTVHSYSSRLIELYNSCKDSEMEKRERREDILCYQDITLDEYRSYRNMCTPKEWIGERKRIIESRENVDKKCEILAEENMPDELFNTIWRSNNKIELVNKYGFLLADRYSGEILNFYSQYVSMLAENACNRSRYNNLKRYLLRMSQYPGGDSLARCLSSEWAAMYPTRKVMVQELQKIWEKK